MVSFKRKAVAADSPFLLGWCMGPDGCALSHTAVDENGEPCDAIDDKGRRIGGYCWGSIIAAADSKQTKKGTRIYCQCWCHGENQPEAWPGYSVEKEAEAVLAPDLDDDEDELDEGDDDPVLDLGGEVPALVIGAPDPDDEVLESSLEAPVSASDHELEVETRVINYENGTVHRMEVPGIGRGGKTVTNVMWVAKDKTGTRLGREWSLVEAKKLL